jgi:CheY-like chemotaxis protein
MKTVLVIEDEAQTRNIYLKCLEFEGFRALGAENGKGGIKLAQHHHPDLVVCDIMMPDIDGYSVLSVLRKSRDTAAIPLIFLTAKVTMEICVVAWNLGPMTISQNPAP